MMLKDLLKSKRVEMGYSQEKLAKVLGYSSGQFVSNWERGESYPPMDRLAKLSLVFKIDDETLLNLFLNESTAATTKEYRKAVDFHKSFK